MIPSAQPARVADAITRRLTHVELLLLAGEYSRDTYDNAKRDLTRFSAAYGDRLIADCQQDDLIRFLVDNPQWKSNSTKRRVLTEILAAFRWCEDERIIDRNPYRWPRGLKLPITPRREAEAAEYIRLMRAGSRPLRRALYFLWNAAVRTKEMRDLQRRWIDWNSGVIWFENHKSFRMTGKPKGIGVPVRVLRFLRNVCRQLPTGQKLVFVNCYGTPWDRHTFARHLRRTAERIGLDDGAVDRVSAYCLRHSAMGEGLEAGVGEQGLADQFGHANLNLIGYYAAQTRRKTSYLSQLANNFDAKRKQVRRKRTSE